MSKRKSKWQVSFLEVTVTVLLALLGAGLERPSLVPRFIVSWQLWSHAILSGMDRRSPRAERVVVVDVDDAAFWGPLHETQPTDRAYLGDLIDAAAKSNAAVIALDFQLKSPTDTWGDIPERAAANKSLEGAITAATQKNIPVVLTTGLVPLPGQSGAFDFQKQWRRQPNIFDDRALLCANSLWGPSSCPPPGPNVQSKARVPGNSNIESNGAVSVGFINLPTDKRMIPLEWRVREWDGESNQNLSSFALQIVNAYEDADHITPRTTENALVRQAIDGEKFVYAGFLKPAVFGRPAESTQGESSAPTAQVGSAVDADPCQGENSALHISSEDLLKNEQTRQLLNHRIVIIGATFHLQPGCQGPEVDAYPSPVGSVPGVYLHANYVESLLDQRFAPPLPVLASLFIDLGFGYFLLVVMHWAEGNAWRLLAVLASVLIPFFAAYVLLVNLGRYLDFVIPMLFLLLHIPIDRLEKIHKHRQSKGVLKHAN